MKIIITGATGLVGTPLTAVLKAMGHDIWRVTRNSSTPQDIAWDVDRNQLDTGKLSGTQGVINLAGENIAGGRWTKARKQRIYDSRIKGTRLLMDSLAALEQKPAFWLNASATGFYRQEAEADESSPPDDSFLAKVCIDWENEARRAEEWGARVALFRIGVVLSPDGGALAKMLPVFKLGLGGPVGSGYQHMSWIVLDDVVATFASAVNDDRFNGPVNLVAPEPVTNRDFSKTLGTVLGRPAFMPAPSFALKMLFGEMANETVLADFRVKPAKLQELDYSYKYPRLEDALNYLLGKA